jgi:hypothetical protein
MFHAAKPPEPMTNQLCCFLKLILLITIIIINKNQFKHTCGKKESYRIGGTVPAPRQAWDRNVSIPKQICEQRKQGLILARYKALHRMSSVLYPPFWAKNTPTVNPSWC